MRSYLKQQQRRGNGQHRDDNDASAPGLAAVPVAVLQRHGARMLNPADAAAVSGWPPPRSTVYRTKTLLVPPELLAGEGLSAVNTALTAVGMRLVPGGQHTTSPPARKGGGLLRLPRVGVLVPDLDATVPVVLDAWIALQALRAAATHTRPDQDQNQNQSRNQNQDRNQDQDESLILNRQTVSEITLDHLLVGSAVSGPASDGGGITGSPASDGGGVTGPGATDSYMYGGTDARIPVALCLRAPARHSAEDCVRSFGRRPVVAVLDSGVREHHWLDVRRNPAAPGEYLTEPDGFVAVDPGMQDVIYSQGEQTAQAGDRPRQQIKGPWDRPVTADPLVGELDAETGHGTFIAGIVRQVAPDAQVLSIRIMHGDGIVYEDALTCALTQVVNRVQAALSGDMTKMIDVVSLSLGYFSETSADRIYSSGLWQLIDSLLSMGVAVTAAAGNYATSRRFYPAAFSDLVTGVDQAPLLSVGALNPNGSKALFSDAGCWVNGWATGAAMVSTFPSDINGSRGPQVRMHAHPANEIPQGMPLPGEREALDPDDYRDGFAIWSGTSFSAPLVAAQIARELLAGAADDSNLKLNLSGSDAALRRITRALKCLGWPG